VKALCDRAVLLEQGRIHADGPPIDVIEEYHRRLFLHKGTNRVAPAASDTSQLEQHRPTAVTHPQLFAPLDLAEPARHERAYGTAEAAIVDLEVTDTNNNARDTFRTGDTAIIRYTVRFHSDVARPICAMNLKLLSGIKVYATNTMINGQSCGPRAAGDELTVQFLLPLNLVAGLYYLTVACVALLDNDRTVLHRRHDVLVLRVLPGACATGIVDLGATICVTTGRRELVA
jgi:lipopolysaccharide transport system ATP-binding protein